MSKTEEAVRMIAKHGAEVRGLSVLELDTSTLRALGYGGGGGSSTARFGRMFDLAPATTSTADLNALGTVMATPRASGDGTSAIPAGFTYFGQFIDHDITLDVTPLPDVERDPLALTNFRTPALDLDSLYGGGPSTRPELYEPGGIKLKVGARETARGPNVGDLPRDEQGVARLGDGRNDENLIVAQLHLSFIRFHNRAVDWFAAHGTAAPNLFAAARRAVQWHYQWVVVHDYLKRIVDPAIVNDILLHGRKFYLPAGPKPFMPVEFSVAAYRFGHSMVRDRYAFQVDGDATFPTATLGDFFRFTEIFAGAVPSHTIAGTSWPMRPKDWRSFVAVDPAHAPQGASLIDTRLAATLSLLPQSGVSDQPNLAARNLQRGRRYGLPSGQAVALAMGQTPLTAAQIKGTDPLPAAVVEETPLWFYILREAEVQGHGNRLGNVGGRIVAEVLIGLLQKDPTSYLNYRPIAVPHTFPLPLSSMPPIPRPIPELDAATLVEHPDRGGFRELVVSAAPSPVAVRAAELGFIGKPAAVAQLNVNDPRVAEGLLKFKAWQPFLGSKRGIFTLADLLRFANEGP